MFTGREQTMSDEWKNRFVEMAMLVSTWSKDPSTKVGAVIVDAVRRVISLGYNGFPRGVDDDPERYANKSVKYAMIVHAEANAILNARAGLVGSILIATKMPCSACSQLIIQAGISDIIAPPSDVEGKWADDAITAKLMLREAYVTVEEIQLPRCGLDVESYYEDGLRKITKDLEPIRDEACNHIMNRHLLHCKCDEPRVEGARDTISRLLRGKSV